MVGVGVGGFITEIRADKQTIARATDYELQDRLDVYREYMRNADRAVCRMNIENVRTYHAIKREIERRRTIGAIVCRYEIADE
jgi:hypothetical protein